MGTAAQVDTNVGGGSYIMAFRYSVALGIALLATALLQIAPHHDYKMAAVAIWTWAITQVITLRFAVTPSHHICPINWAHLAFFIQLVLMPLLGAWFGVSMGTLPQLPPDEAIEYALGISATSYIAFCVGYIIWDRRRRRARFRSPAFIDPCSGPHEGLPLVYLGIGILGALVSFGSLQNILIYYADPAQHRDAHLATTTTFLAAAGTFMKPFLGFGVVMIACRWIDRRGKRSRPLHTAVAGIAISIAIIFAYGLFNYNRGAFIAPLVSLAAAFFARERKASIGRLIFIVAGFVSFILLWGVYRANDASVGDLAGSAELRGQLAEKLELNDTLQVYGGGPQYLGFLLHNSGYAEELYLGRTLISSTLYPVPIIGEAFRESSGVVIYNRMIYGKDAQLDQVIPFQGELFLNFHWPGVLLGYATLGVLTAGLQKRFEGSVRTLDRFVIQYTAFWLLFLVGGSLAVLCQILVYFYWPIYAYMLSKRYQGRARNCAPVGS